MGTRARDRGPRRRARRALALACLAGAGLAAATGCQPLLGPVERAAVAAPVLPETSDPSVVAVGDEYLVYGSDNHLRAPVTRLTDLDRPYTLAEKNARTSEAMPTRPAWAARERQLWAPTVGEFGGRWVMFFAADRRDPPQPWNAQCIGRAWADSPLGPFRPEPAPVHCGIAAVGGALDPQLFTAPDGTRWLLAAFGDTDTPLRSFPLDADANLQGTGFPLLARRHPWEVHFLENPTMVYDAPRRTYLLAYSAGFWFDPGYSTGIARCTSPAGPCTSDPTGPWLSSSNGRTGTGGLSFFTDRDGATRAALASFAAGAESTSGGRSASFMYLRTTPSVTLSVVK